MFTRNFFLLPLAGLFCTTAGAYTPPAGYQITQSIVVNSATFDPVHQAILATVPGSVGGNLGNTVTQIGLTGEILKSTYVGIDPNIISLSNDGSTAYVGTLKGPSIAVYDVGAATVSRQIDLGSTTQLGVNHAVDIAVSPVDKDTIAVVTSGAKIQALTKVVTYTGGVRNPSVDDYDFSDAQIGSVVFDETGSTLYGITNPSSYTFEMYTMHLGPEGLSYGSVTSAASLGNKGLQYRSGVLYGDDGVAFDTNLQVDIGTYNSQTFYPSLISLDVNSGLVYGWSSGGDFTVFNQNTFTPIATVRTGLNLFRISEVMDIGGGNFALVGTYDNKTSNLFFLRAIPEPATRAQMLLGVMLLLGLTLAKRRQQACTTYENP